MVQRKVRLHSGRNVEAIALPRLYALTVLTDELGEEPGCPVLVIPVHEHAGPALVEASRSALVVVVGHRGHSGVAGRILGSVSEHLVRHGEGPVTIVR